MIYHELGKTGMRLSAIGFGASSLGGVFHDFEEAKGVKAVFAAIEAGINFAETVLGKALKDIPRDKFFLSTKVGRYGEDGHNTWDYSAERVTRSVYESMERLSIDYVDLINVHDIEFSDLQQVANETLPALVKLREEGVVKHVGITDLQLENLKWMVEHVPAGTVESVLNFCHYCLNDDKLVDFLDFFEDCGMQRGVPAWHPAPKALVEACRRAAAHCAAKDYPIEKLAMQFSLQNPRIASTLFSTTNPDNLRKNVAYMDEPIDWQLVQEVKQIIGDQCRVSWSNT